MVIIFEAKKDQSIVKQKEKEKLTDVSKSIL